VNGYELGHTEWKITLGMAAGLPAIASPQRSYIEALEGGGGIVAASREDWVEGLEALRDPKRRFELGARARATVVERYSTPVVARRYGDFLLSL
jgi:glycosyltransferase involved in cell wall biosynthesis